MKLLEKFEKLSQTQPDTIAVISGSQSISYAQLESRTRNLGLQLIERGVGPGKRVAIKIEKNIDALCAIIATLRAGGAYVPIDTRISEYRQQRYLDLLAPDLLIENLHFAPTPIDHEKPLSQPPPSAAAYCLFTSGSTGEPKCVEVSRESLDVFINWGTDAVRLNNNDIIGSTTALSFDLSTFDIFGALSSGATLILYPNWIGAFPKELRKCFASDQVTFWYTTPYSFTLLSRQPHGAHLKIRAVALAGDCFPKTDVERWRESLNTEFWNWYGPTETNVCTAYRLPAETTNEPVPIGKPISGSTVSLRDEDGIVVDNGVEGEIWVEGPSVMLGYRTGSDLKKHLGPYKTGDFGRMLPSGDVVFTGRKDQIVKVMGHRVATQEVEAAIKELPWVESTAVVSIPDKISGMKLIALVVSSDNLPRHKELFDHLSKTIPSYMIPDDTRFLAQIPRNENGKTDYGACLVTVLHS